jgi:hypothetical protein
MYYATDEGQLTFLTFFQENLKATVARNPAFRKRRVVIAKKIKRNTFHLPAPLFKVNLRRL